MIQMPIVWDKTALAYTRVIHPTSLSVYQSLTPLSTANMTLPENEDVDLLDMVLITTPDGAQDSYRVANITKDAETNEKSVYLEHCACFLGDYVIPETDTESKKKGTISSLLTEFLSHQSKWSAGTVTPTDTIYVETGGMTILDAINDMMSQIPAYQAVFVGGASNWHVDIIQRPTTPVCEARLSRNVSNCEISLTSQGLCTRVVSSSLSGGVMDSTNVNEMGVHAENMILNDSLSNAQKVAIVTAYLASHSVPQMSVSIAGLELSRLTGLDIDRFSVGTVCRLTLPWMSLVYNEVIVDKRYDDIINDPDSVTFTLANAVPDLTIVVAQAKKGGAAAKKAEKKVDEDHKRYETKFEQTDQYFRWLATDSEWEQMGENWEQNITAYSQIVQTSANLQFVVTQTGSVTNIFNDSTQYHTGDRVMHQGAAYKFTADHLGAWTGTDVVPVDSLYSQIDQTSESISSIVGQTGVVTGQFMVDANYAKGDRVLYGGVAYEFTQPYTANSGWANASVRRVTSLQSQITQEAGKITQIVSAVGENGQVTAASIVTAINNQDGVSESVVTISADKIELEGNAIIGAINGRVTPSGQTALTIGADKLALDGTVIAGYLEGGSLDVNSITAQEVWATDLIFDEGGDSGVETAFYTTTIGNKQNPQQIKFLGENGEFTQAQTITYADFPHYHSLSFDNGVLTLGAAQEGTANTNFNVAESNWYKSNIDSATTAGRNSVVVNSFSFNTPSPSTVTVDTDHPYGVKYSITGSIQLGYQSGVDGQGNPVYTDFGNPIGTGTPYDITRVYNQGYVDGTGSSSASDYVAGQQSVIATAPTYSSIGAYNSSGLAVSVTSNCESQDANHPYSDSETGTIRVPITVAVSNSGIDGGGSMGASARVAVYKPDGSGGYERVSGTGMSKLITLTYAESTGRVVTTDSNGAPVYNITMTGNNSSTVYATKTITVTPTEAITYGKNVTTITTPTWGSVDDSVTNRKTITATFSTNAPTPQTYTYNLQLRRSANWTNHVKNVVLYTGHASYGNRMTMEVDATDQYESGWAAAYGKVSLPTAGTSNSYIQVETPPSTVDGNALQKQYDLRVTKNDAYISIYGSGDTVTDYAHTTHNQFNFGWSGAYGKVSLPTSTPQSLSSDLVIGTPKSAENNTADETTYTVSADDDYAYIKTTVSGTAVTVAKASHSAYAHGWGAAQGDVSLPTAEQTANAYMDVEVPSATVDGEAVSQRYTVSADKDYAYIKAGTTTVARVANVAQRTVSSLSKITLGSSDTGSNVSKSVTVTYSDTTTGTATATIDASAVYQAGAGTALPRSVNSLSAITVPAVSGNDYSSVTVEDVTVFYSDDDEGDVDVSVNASAVFTAGQDSVYPTSATVSNVVANSSTNRAFCTLTVPYTGNAQGVAIENVDVSSVYQAGKKEDTTQQETYEVWFDVDMTDGNTYMKTRKRSVKADLHEVYNQGVSDFVPVVTYYVRVRSGPLYFRQEPRSNAKYWGRLKTNTYAKLLESRSAINGWAHVWYDGYEGYLMDQNNYLYKDTYTSDPGTGGWYGGAPSVSPYANYPYTSYTDSVDGNAIDMRASNSPYSALVITIPNRSTIYCESDPSGYTGDWMKVLYTDGETNYEGYIMAENIPGTNAYNQAHQTTPVTREINYVSINYIYNETANVTLSLQVKYGRAETISSSLNRDGYSKLPNMAQSIDASSVLNSVETNVYATHPESGSGSSSALFITHRAYITVGYTDNTYENRYVQFKSKSSNIVMNANSIAIDNT